MSFWNLSPRGALQRMSESGDVSRFYRALGVMLGSGLPTTLALEQLAGAGGEPVGRRRAQLLRRSLDRGGTLADGAKAPVFLELEEALLRLGEQTGFDASLEALARWFEADHRLSLRIRSAMARPLITVLAGCLILPLPLLVRFGVGGYLLVAVPMAALGLGASGTIVWATFTLLRGRPRYAVARLLWALAIGFEAGLTVERTVRLAAAALGPCQTGRRLLAVPAVSWQGRPLSDTLPEVCQLPAAARAMLQTMDHTGDTARTLRWLATQYEDGTLSP